MRTTNIIGAATISSTMAFSENDERHMRRALLLALRGQGSVEPNPMVGCVIAQGEAVIAEGWHQRFGGPHAEVEALTAAGSRAAGATMYVSLEPCCHHGKTPPCSQAITTAGVRRVVAAMCDPFPAVNGGGLGQLRDAGIEVQSGLLEHEARAINGPYLKLTERARPWVIAKWAMTLDGKLATRTGSSQWISGEASRAVVHRLRGRVDGIIVGRGTAVADDPLLTARPAGPRVATRIVVDTHASLPVTSQLVRTAAEAPVLIAASGEAPADRRAQLEDFGCEIAVCNAATDAERLSQLLDELGRRHMTNVLIEGGAQLLGSLLDAGEIDEVHAFIAPKIVGGQGAISPIGGGGVAEMAAALKLGDVRIERLEDDVYITGRTLN